MRHERITKAVEEMERFRAAINTFRAAYNEAEKVMWNVSPKITGALRRASLDLTRALAEMRKP